VQSPLSGSQAPACWQGPGGAHVTVPAPAHWPFWQESPVVQALLSLHDVPFALGSRTHAPVLALHVPACAHAVSPQLTGLPAHWPDWHESPVVQRSPSLHDVPFALFATEHAPLPGLQTPTVQSPFAGQLFGLLPWQEPDWHVSVWVHAFPSSHDVPFAAAW
jgi:hypothetical protein